MVRQVTAIAFSAKDGIVVSTDTKGMIEYWSSEDYVFPRGKVAFKVCSIYSLTLLLPCLPSAAPSTMIVGVD